MFLSRFSSDIFGKIPVFQERKKAPVPKTEAAAAYSLFFYPIISLLPDPGSLSLFVPACFLFR